MKTPWLILMLLVLSSYAHSQKKAQIDSLHQLLTTTLSSKQKAKVYHELGVAYGRKRSKKAITFYQKAITLRKENGDKKRLAKSYNNLGNIYRKQGDYLQALNLHQKAAELREEIKDNKGLAISYNNLGIVYKNQGNYTQALEFYQKAVKIGEQIQDKKGMAFVYNNIGIVYRSQGDYIKALEFFQKAVSIREQIEDYKGLAFTLNNMGLIYRNQGNDPKALQLYQRALSTNEQIKDVKATAFSYNNLGDVYRQQNNYVKALEFYKTSLSINVKAKDKRGMGFNYTDLGETYRLQKDYLLATENLQKGLEVRQQIKDKSGIAESNLHLGKVALDQQKLDLAKTYFEKALNLRQAMGEQSRSAEVWVNLGIAYFIQENDPKAQEHLEKGVKIAFNTGNPAIIRDGTEYLAKTYQRAGNLQKALDNQIIFKKMTDSLLNAQNIRRITRLQTQFSAQKREDSLRLDQAKKEAQLKADIEQRKARQQTTYVGLGLSIALMVVLLFFYRSTRRNNQKLNIANEELNQTNEELQAANETVQLAHEEIKAINESLEATNQDITSSITYARRIQEATLPLETAMKKYLPYHFVVFRPRDIVSGDFYWCEQVADKTFVTVADCTGHGVPGAFMTMLGAQALNNIVIQQEVYNPNEVLIKLDELLRQMLKSENTLVRDGMSLAFCTIDATQKKLYFAGAKSPLLVVQNDAISEIKGSVYSINGHTKEDQQTDFEVHTVDLTTPTTIYMYSDGYQDQFGGKENKKFMRSRLRNLLFEAASEPIEEQKTLLETTLDEWIGGREQIDDILVMGVKI